MKPITRFGLKIIQAVKLDVPIIKLSKINWVSKVLLKFSWDDADISYFYGIYQAYNKLLQENKISVKDKTILEIGSGRSIGAGYFFLQKNYKKWIASDPFRTPNDSYKFVDKEYSIALEASKSNKEILKNINKTNNEIIFKNKLGFIKLDISNHSNEFDNSFDLILSNAVLEHIPADVMGKAFENMTQSLRKGGFMIHTIDLRDHINNSNPFNFYKYSKSEWESLTTNTIFYTNRLRLSDYLKIFKRNNLKIISMGIKKTDLPKKIHQEIKSKYQDDDLKTHNLVVVLRK